MAVKLMEGEYNSFKILLDSRLNQYTDFCRFALKRIGDREFIVHDVYLIEGNKINKYVCENLLEPGYSEDCARVKTKEGKIIHLDSSLIYVIEIKEDRLQIFCQ